MAEERVWGESAPEAASNDAVAVSLALAGAGRHTADAYLEDQRRHLHELMKQAHLGIWEKRLGVMLRAATMVVGCLFAGGISYLVWDASRADGLRVASFSVPPDLAAQGLTGEVAAARVIDRLGQLQVQTNTARSARSYTNAWGDKAIKLEIAEAGISLTELDNWLREKVGHETILSGEIVRTKTGFTLTARAGTDGAATVSGPDTDIDALVGRLAEEIYRITQPYRYATWLYRHESRAADARPIFRDLALNGSPADRAWSYNMWAQTETNLAGDTEAGVRWYGQAVAADPEGIGAYTGLAGSLNSLGRSEESLRVTREWLARLGDGKQIYVPADQVPAAEKRVQAQIDRSMGAYADALPVDAPYLKTGLAGYGAANILSWMIADQAGAHDLAAAARSVTDYPAGTAADRYVLQLAFLSEDWNRALGYGDAMAAFLKANPQDRHFAIAAYSPRLALAQAHLGDFAAAEKTIAPTEAACYPCLIARAQIAELRGQRARADFWFTRATVAGPSLPFAFEAEGRALLDRKLPDQAIARFTIANQRAPHFADAIEGAGEALMAKNQAHLALAKFAEAEKYAPNWGRLHLKWGEALTYAGRKEDAAQQFARAAALDLTPSEKSELAKVPHG